MFREWIERGLQKPGKSKSGLARALGRDPAQVTRIVNGTREIKIAELVKIAAYIGEPPPGINLDQAEAMLLEVYRETDEAGKRLLESMAERLRPSAGRTSK